MLNNNKTSNFKEKKDSLNGLKPIEELSNNQLINIAKMRDEVENTDKHTKDAINMLESSKKVDDKKARKEVLSQFAVTPLLALKGASQKLEGAYDTMYDLSSKINEGLLNKTGVISDEEYNKRREQARNYVADNKTENFYNRYNLNDTLEKGEKHSLVKRDNLLGKTVEGVGGMLPTILLSSAVGVPSYNPTKASSLKGLIKNIGTHALINAPTNVTFGTSAYGNALAEAYSAGATDEEATKYAISSTAVEIASEWITGGIPGTNGVGGLDILVDKGIDKISNQLVKELVNYGYKMVGEGVEEAIAEILNPILKNATYSSGNEIDWKSVIESAIVGGLTAGVLEAPNMINNISNDIRQNNNINSNDNTVLPKAKTSNSLSDSVQNNIGNQVNENAYQYIQSDNEKINNLRKSAVEIGKFVNNEKTRSVMNVAEKLISDKNYNIVFDNTLTNDKGNMINAQITTLENGETEIRLNPNSERAAEFLLIHEVSHGIKTQEMIDLVNDYASKNPEFNQAVKSLEQLYGKDLTSEEVFADVCGQLFGNQEFIINLSTTKPSIFRRIYNKIVELANKITGNSKESLFIKDLKNKWENAYRTQNNNLNGKTNYYIENIASFDENEYNNIKQEILNNLEFANLASIINSDQSVKPGKNIIESIYDYNSGKYKDYEIYYKSSGEFKIIKSKDSGVDSNVKYSKSSDSRNETTGSRQTNNQLGNRVVENTNATPKNDELFDINQRDAHSKRQSNRHDRQNSRELDNSSFSLEQRVSGDALLDAQDFIDEVKSVGAEVDDNGYVTVYHQTSNENADKIKQSGKMFAKEPYVYFSTSKNASQSDGRGSTKLEFKIPAENLILDDIFDDNADVKVKLDSSKELDISDYLVNDENDIGSLKEKQLNIILKNNPVNDDYHTWIRNINDIKTFEETLQDSDYKEYYEAGEDFDETYSANMAKEALETGKITIYSSYPIEQGIFVSPSRMEAESYSGNGKVYSKEVNIDDVAWIDPTQGQYAKVQEKIAQNNLNVDNQGRTLTKEQQEYFKDSKVRDEKGRLLEVYHGTNNGEFTKFNKDYIGSSNDAGWYGKGFYFAFSESEAKTYGNKVIKAYLNIKNPFNFTDEMQTFNGKYTSDVNEDFGAFMINLDDKFHEIAENNTIKYADWDYNEDGSRDVKKMSLSQLAQEIKKVYNSPKLRIIEINDGGKTKYQYVYSDNFKETDIPQDIRKIIEENHILNKNDIDFAVREKKYYPNLTEEKINKLYDFFNETNYDFTTNTVGWLQDSKETLEKNRLSYATNVVNEKIHSYIDMHMPEVYMEYLGEDISNKLKEMGYDGVIQSSRGDEIVAFYPNQIKNVDNTNPTSNEDIRYSQNNNRWQEHLEKNYKATGTRTMFSEMKSNTTKQNDNNSKTKNQTKKIMNPLEISKITKEDANTTPILKKINVSTGDGESRFASNIKNKTDMLSQSSKDTILSSDDVRFYQKVTNQESLEKAFERLNKNGRSETENWLRKNSENATSVDVAEGWILLKQYQDSITKETDINTKNELNRSMVEVAKKLREIGTKAGQTVQAFNILNRLTPEGMVYYAQSELSEAYEKMSQNKTKEWIDSNRDRFELTPEETKFIMDTMQEVQQMEDGYDKRVKLAEIQKLMTDKLPPERGAGIKAWMRMSMLFNPKTQVRNVMGNAIIAPVNSFSDLFASIVDKQIAKKTGVRTTGKTDLKNYSKGFKKGLYQSYNDFKKGINTRNMQGNRFEVTEGKSFNDNSKIGKQLNKVDSLLSFMLDAGDRGFYEASFTNSINNQMILNNTTEVTQDMIDIATSEALSRTWQDNNNYTKFVLQTRNALNKINIKGYGLGDVLIPFAKTPANLTKAIVDYSPLGMVNAINSGINLKNSISNGQYNAKMQHQFVQNLGKATAGTMLYILGYALAKAGITSGESDDDKDTKDFMKNTLGINSYSIKIGNKSFTYDWAQPIAAPLSITANIVNKQKESATLTENILSSLDTAGNILLEQSFMESINTVLNNNDGIVTGIQEAIFELPSRAIPTLMKQIVDLTDDTQRTTFEYDKPLKTAVNKVKAKIPGLSKTLSPVVDTMGREVKRYGGKNNIFNVFLNPANVNTENISKSAQEIYRVYKSTGDKTVMPRVIPYYFNEDGVKRTLTSKERSQFQKISGEIIEENIVNLINNSNYTNMNDIDKSTVLNNLVNYAYNKARYEMFGTEMSNLYNKVNEWTEQGKSVADYYANKEENDYSLENPKKYNTITNFNLSYESYTKYSKEINSIKNQYNDTNSRKNAVWQYIQNQKIPKVQKILLYNLCGGYSISNYKDYMFNYLNSQNISKIEKQEIWKYLYE